MHATLMQVCPDQRLLLRLTPGHLTTAIIVCLSMFKSQKKATPTSEGIKNLLLDDRIPFLFVPPQL